ncbi:hypothetical protein Tco_0280695 [Tanacetum coccineum]
MVANSIDFVTSVLSQRDLDLFCRTYNIPADLRPELPGRDDTIQNSLARKIGIYTPFIEFANFRIPLYRFLISVLQYYQINFSQLSVLCAAKVSHFQIMCRVLGHQPSLGTFGRFYVNSTGWLSFSRRDPTPCYFLKKFDTLKSWNDHFLWIDASIFPIFISWYNDVSVRRDPLPFETFLCHVRLSRSFDDLHVRPTLLKSDESDMGLLDFVKFVDPFKVKTGERTLAEDEVSLLTETADMVLSPTAHVIRLVDHTIANELEEHAGKKKRKVSLTALKRLELQSGPQGNESGFALHPSEEFMSSSVTPTPEHDILEDSGSTQDVNVQARRPPDRYVIVTSSFEHGDVNANVSPKVKSRLPHVDVEVEKAENVATKFADGARAFSILGNNAKTFAFVPDGESPTDEFYESQTVDSPTTQMVYVPKWNVTNDARVDNPALCRNLLNHITPPGY